jgi:hypothetical protein
MTRTLTKGTARGSVQAVSAPQSLSSTRTRFWIETIALVSMIACVLALLIATLGAVAGAAAKEPESGQSGASSTARTYEGMITDTRCGAKHSAAISRTAADCTMACVRGGEQFVLVDGDTVYFLEGGQRARIVGTLNGRRISVASVVTA